MSQQKHLGEYLVETGTLNSQCIQTALHIQQHIGGFFGQVLVEKGWITEQKLCQALSEMLRVQWVNIDSLLISEDILQLVPKSLAMVGNILPLFAHKNRLYLAMENPCDTSLIRFIEDKANMRVKPLLAPVRQLQRMIRQNYYYDPVSS